MFICTFNEEIKKELDKELKLVQASKLNGKIIYIYMFFIGFDIVRFYDSKISLY